ncbi:unnamed protein product [Bemisia tabaci]|uniref:RNA-directed RNA polymerase C-terminal domain-containing protein n=1 Tax=Bemisia tabaci TaxID=7038 RepID=A0A9P0F2L8_BEMTA|nr:unnamed protein product [Bemisia tabaci]
MDEERTLKYVKRLRPYSLNLGPGNTDPYVREILEQRSVSEDNLYSQRLLNSVHFQFAIRRFKEEFADLRSTPIPTNQLDKVVWQPNTSAGYGYIGHKRDNYLKARSNASRTLYDFDKWREIYRPVPDKAFARCQLTLRANAKVRHIWGRPFHHILLEGCIAQPILEKLLYNDNPIYIGKDLHKDLPYDILRLMEEGGTAYCLDFSRFDSTLCRGMISTVWDIIFWLCPPQTEADLLNYKFCRYLFTNNPIVMPDGKLFISTTGLPSGSYFTGIVGSIANLLLIYMLLSYFRRSTSKVKVLGDDSIFALLIPIVNPRKIETFLARYGMIVNLVKSIITKLFSEIVFLGHNYYGSRVTRDEFTCLSLALYSENDVPTPAFSIVRLASLIYDSGFNSFGLLHIYKEMLSKHNIDWSLEDSRPTTVNHPFYELFVNS